MKLVLLLLTLAVLPTFAFNVHIVEKETLAGVIQYFTVRDNDKVCLMDYNVTTQTVSFHLCYTK